MQLTSTTARVATAALTALSIGTIALGAASADAAGDSERNTTVDTHVVHVDAGTELPPRPEGAVLFDKEIVTK